MIESRFYWVTGFILVLVGLLTMGATYGIHHAGVAIAADVEAAQHEVPPRSKPPAPVPDPMREGTPVALTLEGAQR